MKFNFNNNDYDINVDENTSPLLFHSDTVACHFWYLHFVKVGKAAAEAHYFQGMQTKKVWSRA